MYAMMKSLVFPALCVAAVLSAGRCADAVTLEAAAPSAQQGSTGEDRKAGSHYGHVLGHEWGGHMGDWAQYAFVAPAAHSAAYLHLRYARANDGNARFRVTLDA